MSSDSNASLAALTTESLNQASAHLSSMDALGIVQTMNAEDAGVAAAVAAETPRIARAVTEIAARLQQGGRLIYVGAGTSGRLGVLDAAECPPTFNTPPDLVIGVIAGGAPALTRAVEDVEDSADMGRQDLLRLQVSEVDCVVGVTASGRTPYVLGAVACAAEHRALTVGLASNAGTPIEECVDIMIHPVVGPEVIAGSTRLKSGTAQKMVLNMLSTGSMVLLGKTFDNLMVDLVATNEKLRDRAVRILRAATGLHDVEARALLVASGGSLKVAIVAARAAIDVVEASRRLTSSGGRIQAAIDDDPRPEGGRA
ncbi:MAG: N-acetylmuramic acid 6-phosphate etherase [Chloroflexota bacterium]